MEKLLWHFDQLEIKKIFLAVAKLLHSRDLFVKSKQWKRQSNLWNLFKGNSKDTEWRH